MAKKTEESISVLQVSRGVLTAHIRGTTPLIFNTFSPPAIRTILCPGGKKNAAEKAATLKHNPMQEFRDSARTAPEATAPTRLILTAAAFRSALASVAVDMPGAAKSQIGRLTSIQDPDVHIYGVPQIMMSMVIQAGMSRTPDVRTRMVVPKWAAVVSITYVKPILNDQIIANLLAAAGIMRGVGDWRPEKGKGSYGQFEIVNKDDAEFQSILATGGRAAQDEKIENPDCFDLRTEELLHWYNAEVKRRGMKAVA